MGGGVGGSTGCVSCLLAAGCLQAWKSSSRHSAASRRDRPSKLPPCRPLKRLSTGPDTPSPGRTETTSRPTWPKTMMVTKRTSRPRLASRKPITAPGAEGWGREGAVRWGGGGETRRDGWCQGRQRCCRLFFETCCCNPSSHRRTSCEWKRPTTPAAGTNGAATRPPSPPSPPPSSPRPQTPKPHHGHHHAEHSPHMNAGAMPRRASTAVRPFAYVAIFMPR